MLRLLHLADVHLDAPLAVFGELAARRRAEVHEAFLGLPEIAEREDAAAVLIAGDLFDGSRPGERALAVVRETFRRLTEAGRPVLLIPGNHDALTLRPSPYDVPLGEVTIFRDPTFRAPVRIETPAGPLYVYGIAYDPAEEPEPLATFRRLDAPGMHVVLLHGSVPDAPHWEPGRSLRLPLDRLAELEADYLALGDHHRFRPPGEFGRGGSLPACYPGSFAAVDFTESGPHGLAVVELAPRTAPVVRLVESGVPPIVWLGELDVSACTDDLEIADRVATRSPEGCLPVVTLVGQPEFPVDAQRVADQLLARFRAARVTDETRYYATQRVRELMRGGTVVAHLARLGVQRVEAAGDPESRRTHERALRLALAALEAE